MKKFSIVTLTFNSAKTIKDNIKSVNSQNYKNLEHICFDSKSSDKTLSLLNKFKNNKRKIFTSKERGIYKSLNSAIKKVSGSYVGILHSDDVLVGKNTIKLIADKFKNPKINIIYTNIKIVKKKNLKKVLRNWISNKKSYKNKILNSTDYIKIIKNGWMPPHTGFFIRKKILDRYRYNTKYLISSDYDFMLKVLKNFNGIYYLPITSTLMRVGGKSSKISNLLRKMQEDLRIIKENKIGGYTTLLKKNLSKIKQFFYHKSTGDF